LRLSSSAIFGMKFPMNPRSSAPMVVSKTPYQTR
jgi:hypothetical protein